MKRAILAVMLMLLSLPAVAQRDTTGANALAAINAACGNCAVGVSIADPTDKATWRIDFTDTATAQQKTDAAAAVTAFDRTAPTAEEARLGSFSNGNAASCNVASLALTADCVAFVEDKLKTMNASQFASWYTTNVNTQAKAQTVLGLVTMVLAHQVRLN
jgi:hypothetical protein